MMMVMTVMTVMMVMMVMMNNATIIIGNNNGMDLYCYK